MISVANSDGRLPSHYTHAKFKTVLPITSKDIHNFINIIYYSWVHTYIHTIFIQPR